MMMDYTMKMIVRDMTTLIPFVVVVVSLILFFSFRTVRGVVLPLLVVGMATLWTLGIMAFLGRPLTLISAIMPVVLIATGTAYAIHLLNRHRALAVLDEDKQDGIVRTVTTIGVPIVLTGVTTFAGFVSLRASSMVIFQDFGTFTAIGVFLSLVVTILFLPAILSWRPLPKHVIKKRDTEDLLLSLLGRLGRTVHCNPKWIISCVVCVLIFAGFLIPNIHREINFLSFFCTGKRTPSR